MSQEYSEPDDQEGNEVPHTNAQDSPADTAKFKQEITKVTESTICECSTELEAMKSITSGSKKQW